MLVSIRNFGIQEYTETWRAMQRFTESRDRDTQDEFWVLQHYPVYTQGLNGKPENILDPDSIPVIQTDRGGQSTYHGPGQLVIYTLIDLKRKNIGVRDLVTVLANAAILTLRQYGIFATCQLNAPGVYVAKKKIASVGLRIRHGCSYHGLSLNVCMDLSPFNGIHTCGFKDLEVTQIANLCGPKNPIEVSLPVIQHLIALLDFEGVARHQTSKMVDIA